MLLVEFWILKVVGDVVDHHLEYQRISIDKNLFINFLNLMSAGQIVFELRVFDDLEHHSADFEGD